MKTTSRFAGLGERARAGTMPPAKVGAKPDKEDEEDNADGGADEASEGEASSEDDGEDTTNKPIQKTTKKGNAMNPDLNSRMKAVFASGEVKGKENFAASIMADNDFDSLNASAVIKIISMAASPAPVASNDDGATKILDAIAKQNAKVGADGGDEEIDTEKQHAAGWSKATASVNKRNGF